MERTFTPRRDHFISLDDAKKIIKVGNKDTPYAALVTKKELLEVLNQEGCIGIKIYVNNGSKEINPVIVGINAKGEELREKIIGRFPPFSLGDSTSIFSKR